MLDKELQLALIKKTLSKGGEYADVFTEVRKQTSLVLDDGRLEKIVEGSEAGVGVRLIYDNKTFYAYSNDLSEDALMAVASQTGKAAAGGAVVSNLDLRSRKPSVKFDVELTPSDVPLGRKIAVVRAADSAARNFDRRIRQVSAVYGDVIQKVQIATSDGFIAQDERQYTSFTVHTVAVSGDVIQTGYESAGGLIGFELIENNDIEGLSIKAAGRAVMMLSAGKAKGGRMPVVILSSAGGTMIHEAIGHGLEADLAQQGFSVYSGKIGSHVASRVITVLDDSTLRGMRGSFSFDDEGTPSQRTILVEEGVLKNYMYDKLTATKDGTASTGNGRRQSYMYRPIPRMTNTLIAPGDTPPEAIIRSLDKGLLVAKMGGGQVNTVTGDFVFDVQEAYVIERGMKGEPVRGATLTGNGPQILRSLDMVGDDLGFSIGTCGKDGQGVFVSDAMPTVRIPEIVVGGAYG